MWWSKWWPQAAENQKYINDYLQLSRLELNWDEAWIIEENEVLLALENSGLGG